MGRLYKINPPCPKCHEEHNWWHIQLTDEEQAIEHKVKFSMKHFGNYVVIQLQLWANMFRRLWW